MGLIMVMVIRIWMIMILIVVMPFMQMMSKIKKCFLLLTTTFNVSTNKKRKTSYHPKHLFERIIRSIKSSLFFP